MPHPPQLLLSTRNRVRSLILQVFQLAISIFHSRFSLRSLDPLAAFGLSTQSVDFKGFRDIVRVFVVSHAQLT
ncbi:MAG: hypothetical protein QNJ46_12320 [Leptolyngbyaceae cyanobacterium MO_188.B28]|nr:hypothetical protein [Leptolyngbyaceae cyanobacterium MO_188.B28]